MRLFLGEAAARHPNDRISAVLGGVGWRQGEPLVSPANLRPLKLPPYSTELDPAEHLWDESHEKYFRNLVSGCLDAPEKHLESALPEMELPAICTLPNRRRVLRHRSCWTDGGYWPTGRLCACS